MKTISIRVEDDIFNKMEELRGSRPKSEFYRSILENYMENPEDGPNKTEDILKENESLKSELSHKEELTRALEERIKSTENQLGFLQHEYGKVTRIFDQLLLPEPAQAKKWWEFWK